MLIAEHGDLEISANILGNGPYELYGKDCAEKTGLAKNAAKTALRIGLLKALKFFGLLTRMALVTAYVPYGFWVCAAMNAVAIWKLVND